MPKFLRRSLRPFPASLFDFALKSSASGVTYKTAVAQSGQKIADFADEDNLADLYFGNDSEMNFGDYEGNVSMNLSGNSAFGNSSIGSATVLVQGMSSLVGGQGENTLIGSSEGDYIEAGAGASSLWGSSGNDTLSGFTGDKNGATTFFFTSGDGKNVVQNFETLTLDNATTADKISALASVSANISGEDLVLKIADTSDKLTIQNAAGKDVQMNDQVWQVAENTLTFDGLASNYLATTQKQDAAVSVSADVSSANIWLEGVEGLSEGAAIFSGNVKSVDASNVEGNAILAGNSLDNVIKAGRGGASLWGGISASNDSLIGGEGADVFFYATGQGDDTVSGATSDDVIKLYNLTADNLGELLTNPADCVQADSITLKFNSGSLHIDSNNDYTFELADGKRYTYSTSDSEWKLS